MPMKTIEGYSKEKYTDTSVLLAGGGAKALSSFIGSLTWDSTNKKIQYTPVGGNATDLVTLSWDNISGKPDSFTPASHDHDSVYAKLGAHNNLTASGNEFTSAASGQSGAYYWNYRTAGGTNGNITSYILGDGKGGTLGTIIHSGNIGSQSVNYAASAGDADTVDGIDGTYIFRQIRSFSGASSDNTWVKIQKKGQYNTGTCLITIYQWGHVCSFVFSINNTYPARSTLAAVSKDSGNLASNFKLSYSSSEGYFYFKIGKDYKVVLFGSGTANGMLGTGELVTSTPADLAECYNISINVADSVGHTLSWSGYSSGSFNGSADGSITIPDNTNQLTNGANFITASSNITGTAAGITGYTFKTLSSASHSGWTNKTTDNKIIPTMSFIAYWNGAYNSSNNSNLQYCDRGRFGTIVTKSTTDYAAAGHNHDGAYWPLATESYPYLRPGTSNNWIKVGSANDSYGLLPSQAGSAGSGHNYLGTSSWYWKYAYIDNVTVASNLTASSTVVFSGLNQGTSAPSDETEFLTSYAGTGGFANTTGAGKVYRRSMSLLWDYISDKVGDTYYKIGRNSNNLNSATTTWNGILPINAFGFRHGKAVWMYSDLDNVTSASWYNGGSGSGTVTVMTDAEALADNSSYTPSGNSSGKVLKIEPTGSIVSNKIGGTAFRTVTAKDNAVWLQVVRAWLPVGASITAAMNGTGTGRSYYWITSKEGTGKWEWYACLHINGHGGTMSTFGHTYATLSGAAIGVKWYIASFQIYELTNNNYDSLRSRYADSASAVPWSGISDIPSTFTPASHNHAAGDITSGTLGVARGGTGKASWTQYGLVYASATTTLAQVSQTWAASKTYWLKAVTNASKVPTYSFVDSLTSDKVTITYDSTGTDYKYVTFTDGQYGEQILKAHYNLEYIPAIGSLQPYLLNGYRTAGYGVYLCRYYKSGGSSTGYVNVGPTGAGIVNGASASGNFSGTDTKVEDGKHTITLTNGTKSYWCVWPVLQVHYNITGSQDDCMEFGWANFYDSSSTGVKNVSPGGTVSFTFCCGRIHCQGSWAARDYVRLTDTPGITITFFGSQAY